MCCFAEFIVKYVLFFTNLVFTLAGAALIGLGIAVLVQFSGATDIIEGSVKLVPISIIVVGSIIFLIAFFGCCGAIKENCCMLTTYAIFMALLAAVKIWITVVVYRGLGNLDNLVTDWITGAYSEHPNEFNAIESAFECCGTIGAGTYLPGPLPATCCAPSEATCVQGNAYPGCVSVVSQFLDDIGSGIGGVIITVIIVEVVAVLFGLCMAFASSKNKQQRAQYA
ncbi:hypothetical protein JYU34_013328 [Plutella xylostella]|uniref:Tetraspanin n=1 Tax=Plutella xylostella TaxID=51655 RepID=A0ABQ7QAW7_PLUXY|nr:hypothetical protein JYU34_013328 [Plutella xylostella]